MKKILALGVGVVLAWAPASPAFAAAEAHGTGNGKAYGNCGHSSATGLHAPLAKGAGNGNGGHVKTTCETEPVDPVVGPVLPELPEQVDSSKGNVH